MNRADNPFVQIFRPHPIHPIRKRLWQAAGALALIVFILVGREVIVRNLDSSRRLFVGEDFLPVYAAGMLVRQGRAADLYAMQPLASVEQRIVAEADLEPLRDYGPFLNPPFFAAAYAPFTLLPYRPALALWATLNGLLLIGSAMLLCSMLPRYCGWPSRALVCLLLVLPMPFWEAVWYQQNTFLSLFLTCGIVSLWRLPAGRGKWYWPDASAFLCGLLFYKPQLALVLATALVITRNIRACISLAVTGSILLLFTLIRMRGALGAFVHSLPPTIDWLRYTLPYKWGQQLTWQSFWRLLIQGHGPGRTHLLPRSLAVATSIAFGLGLTAAALRIVRRGRCDVSIHRFIAAAICTTPLLMPYYMDYDVLLLAVPAVLLASEWMRNTAQVTRSDWFLFATWIALFLETYVNPGLGDHLRLNLAVPLIGAIAAVSIARCFRAPVVASVPIGRYDISDLATAA